MKTISSIVILYFLFLTGCSQKLVSQSQDLNLDFEKHEKGFPIKWDNFGSGDYKIYIDSLQSKSGKYAAVIENTGDSSNFNALSLILPDNYDGKSITLSGYIKTEDVSDGYAGLWMRIDPQIGFDNMGDRGVTGTTDWKEYNVTLDLSPEKTERIFIGGLLVGKGKMWLDDLKVTIDGKSLEDPTLELWGSNADRDREFDNGSNIIISELGQQDIDNLELLGRVWGFMKYYHPEIATGEYNWDYELFRVLPEYLKVKNSSERDQILEKWIEKFGSLPTCTTCKEAAGDAVLKPDLAWIDKSDISNSLKNNLRDIYNNRNQATHYYISIHEAGNPNFKNERTYSNMLYPDDGFRLLSIYRYWNMMEYFFPYKHLTDKEWGTVLREYIPKFVHAKDGLEYELAALQVIGEINDTHAGLSGGAHTIQQLRGWYFPPLKTDFIEGQLVVTDYHKSDFPQMTKLKIGDVITHVNGKTIESLVDSLRPYYPHSNEAAMLRDISKDLLRSSDSTVYINYSSSNQQKKTEVNLYNYRDLTTQAQHQEKKQQPTFKLLRDSIGYFTLASVKLSDVAGLKNVLGDLKGLVVDIRNYPNQFVALPLSALFISENTEFVKFSQINLNNPGEFNCRRGATIKPERYNYPNTRSKPFTGKLVVLVNETSQSQAEYTAMALRAVPNSLIVGSTTAGADGDCSTLVLPGGLNSIISGIGVYYPDGTETQRIGIVPDIIVKPTIGGIKNGQDEVLEKAIEILNLSLNNYLYDSGGNHD